MEGITLLNQFESLDFYDTCKKINHAFDSKAKLPDAEFLPNDFNPTHFKEQGKDYGP